MPFGKRITSLGPSARDGDQGSGKPNKYRKTLNGNFIKQGGAGSDQDNKSIRVSRSHRRTT
jgi:hypothetical protein